MNAARFSSGGAASDVGGNTPNVPAPSIRQRLGKRYENRKHLEYVSLLPCMICNGEAQAHHLLRPWSGIRGTGRRAGDENVLPLCHEHHTALHRHGDEDDWFFIQFGNVSSGRARAEGLWLNSPHYVALLQGDENHD